jgi:hypothetical protein
MTPPLQLGYHQPAFLLSASNISGGLDLAPDCRVLAIFVKVNPSTGGGRGGVCDRWAWCRIDLGLETAEVAYAVAVL